MNRPKSLSLQEGWTSAQQQHALCKLLTGLISTQRVHCDSNLCDVGCTPLERAPASWENVKYTPRLLSLHWGLKLHRTSKQEAAAFKNTRVGERQGD